MQGGTQLFGSMKYCMNDNKQTINAACQKHKYHTEFVWHYVVKTGKNCPSKNLSLPTKKVEFFYQLLLTFPTKTVFSSKNHNPD